MENEFSKIYRKRIQQKKELEDKTKKIIVTVAAIVFAFFFIMPTLLTFTNSFMAATEINANYGSVFDNYNKSDGSARTYISKTVNLKFIPDMVTFNQYFTVLLKSPEYLFKFWYSVIYTVPIVFVQLALASFAAYGFSRHESRAKKVIFFIYIII